jgi:hypothetical protein
MSDSDSDDLEQEPNWEHLRETLGARALEALREHWTAKQAGDTAADAPVLRAAMETDSFFHPGPVAVTSNLDFKTHRYDAEEHSGL